MLRLTLSSRCQPAGRHDLRDRRDDHDGQRGVLVLGAAVVDDGTQGRTSAANSATEAIIGGASKRRRPLPSQAPTGAPIVVPAPVPQMNPGKAAPRQASGSPVGQSRLV